jgi:serine/threonine protein kinase/WD40 repeat protein
VLELALGRGDSKEPAAGHNESASITHEEALNDKLRDEIAGYRLLQEIGHGGCGVVYMAEQEKPVNRRVALKVIKIGMDTRQVVARFEAERQALARMDHPNIAKVLEAGATNRGRPYFAMELVGGLKITDYCDQNELPTVERLRLFVQVCRAIQHAHQKGIIHRDIKPSNVLVANHDGVAVPKVIDFGIAKATQGKLIDQTLFTPFEQFIGTPVYMSPEQADLGGLDVDTRSDIYSLGVLLYELLTGKTPFELESSKGAGIDALRRTVIEKEPVRPSTRVHALSNEQLTSVARARRIEAPRLVKMLRGDLDWIVMKCLEKDRARRYETANGLAMDIERYLNRELVVARPPSAAYRVQKFIQRNRVATLSAAAISLALISGTTVSTWEAVKARRAEREQGRLMREAQVAKRDATEKLWAEYTAEARARRLSREAGVSFDSLEALAKAAAIRPSLRLRNEAIASLALADIRLIGSKRLGVDVRSGMPDRSAQWYAVCDRAGTVTVRRLADDREVGRIPATNSAAVAVWGFSPDGAFLLVGYNANTIRLWDWERSLCLVEVPRAATADFSPEGERLAVLTDGRLLCFDLRQTGQQPANPVKSIEVPNGLWMLRYHPTRDIAAILGESETNLFLLDLNSGRSILTIAHKSGLFRATWSHDGRYLVSTPNNTDNQVHIWDITTGKEFRSLPSLQTVCAVFSPQGTILATSGWDGRTRLWDILTGRELVNIYRSGSIIDFSPDGSKLIETEWEGHGINYFEVASSHCLRTLFVHERDARPPFGVVSFSHNGKLLAFTSAEGPKLWDVVNDRELDNYGDRDAMVLGFDSEDQSVLMNDKEGFLLWPLLHERKSQEMQRASSDPPIIAGKPVRQPEKVIGGGVFSGDSKRLFIGAKNHGQVLDARTLKTIAVTGFHGGARFITANFDASLVATGAWLSPGVKVWNGKTGELVHSFDTPDTTSVAFSPDNRFLVLASAENYEVWQVESWTHKFTIPQEPGNDFVPMMAFSPDGRILAGTHSRRIVRLHSALTGEVLADLEPPEPHAVTSVCFNNDGTRLAVCEGYEAVRIWDLTAIRSRLAPLGLDWELPPQPANQAGR